MLFGVISFSFATSSLSQIISQYNNNQKQLREDINVLDQIQEQYEIDDQMYAELFNFIQIHSNRQSNEDIEKFQEKLPYQLKMKLTKHMYSEIYDGIKFFRDKPIEFLALIAPLLVQTEI